MQTIPQDTKNADNPLLESATISPQQALEQQDARTDRNFDASADHFEKKVYGGLKGEIRLAVLRRDIFEYSAKMSEKLGRPFDD
ncbi:MAG: hypothetical protein EOM68_04760 [Spirochaetia bacterium]|nr:hypothetical protein [Spirochaetia bacterium]